MNHFYKNESIVIFGSILIILLFYVCYLIFKKLSNIKYNDSEYFNNSNSKRSKMIKIYKKNDMSDPDEDTNKTIDDYITDTDIDIDNSKPNDKDAYISKHYDPDIYSYNSSYISKIYDPYSSIGYGYNPYS